MKALFLVLFFFAFNVRAFALDCISSNLACYPTQAVCSALMVKDGLQSLITPALQNELLDSGWLEVWETSVFRNAESEMNGLKDDHQTSIELGSALEKIGISIDKLEKNARSKWFYFFSFSWLGSGVVAKQAVKLGEQQAEQFLLKSKLHSLKAKVDRYLQLRDTLPKFRESQGRFVSTTDKGIEWLNKLDSFSWLEGSTLKQVLTNLEVIDSLMERYDSVRKLGLYSSDHAPTLALASMYFGKTPEQVFAIYQQFRSLRLYSSDHAPSLVMSVLQNKKSVEDVFKLYQDFRATNELYSSDLAPALVGYALKYQRTVDQVMTYYRELSKFNIYSSNHKPALIGSALSSGKSISEVATLYSEIRSTNQLYSSDHAPTLVQAVLSFSKTKEEVIALYQQFRGMSLYSSNHAPALVMISLSSKKSPQEVYAFYKSFRSRNLYSSNHAVPLTSGAPGLSSALFDQNTFSSIEEAASQNASLSSSSTDDGSTFNFTWAVMGDFMDNGSLDLSGGFAAGGLLGGLLD